MTQNTGWNFTYDYKQGDAGRIGTAYVAKAAPDGHTMLMISSTITYSHLMKNKQSYDWRKDLAPVYQLNRTTGILMVTPGLPVKSVSEYIAYGKANPGKINYATVGTGGIVHLVAEQMHSMMGIKVTYVPYKGYGPITTALVAGEVHAAHPTYKAFQAFITSGRVRPIGLTAAHARLPQLPNLRSIAEEGVPEFDNFTWVGIFVPSGVSSAIVNRMNGEFAKAAQSPDVVKRLTDLGESPGGGSPEEFRRFLFQTSERLTKVIKDTGIELEE
jgi:tripartite-type tricarboxylate transporter receptor subunit TctC